MLKIRFARVKALVVIPLAEDRMPYSSRDRTEEMYKDNRRRRGEKRFVAHNKAADYFAGFSFTLV